MIKYIKNILKSKDSPSPSTNPLDDRNYLNDLSDKPCGDMIVQIDSNSDDCIIGFDFLDFSDETVHKWATFLVTVIDREILPLFLNACELWADKKGISNNELANRATFVEKVYSEIARISEQRSEMGILLEEEPAIRPSQVFGVVNPIDGV